MKRTDVENAFLLGNVDVEVYMSLPLRVFVRVTNKKMSVAKVFVWFGAIS